jgi:hypothetical protein
MDKVLNSISVPQKFLSLIHRKATQPHHTHTHTLLNLTYVQSGGPLKFREKIILIIEHIPPKIIN